MTPLEAALQWYGYTEQSNPAHVLSCLALCDDLSSEAKSTVNTPWCAAGMCMAIERAGEVSPRSAAAKSFTEYGSAVEGRPCIGDIAVLKREGGHHVTFFIRRVNPRVFYGYGANQSDGWWFKQFEFSRLLSFRRA